MLPDDDDADPSAAYEPLQPLLLVDDNDDARSLIAEVLRLDGFRVIEACDGPEALAACARELPWLVILDHVMPCMSGIEVATRLAQDPELATIPVVFASGSVLPDRVPPNVVSRLTKPITSCRLLEVVRACAAASSLDHRESRAGAQWGDGAHHAPGL
jgi:CheY-like chemotaxis protein